MSVEIFLLLREVIGNDNHVVELLTGLGHATTRELTIPALQA